MFCLPSTLRAVQGATPYVRLSIKDVQPWGSFVRSIQPKLWSLTLLVNRGLNPYSHVTPKATFLFCSIEFQISSLVGRHYPTDNIGKLTSEVRFHVLDILLEYPMHNSTADFRLRLLIRISRAYGVFNIESHTPLSITLPPSVCLQELTPYDYTLTILPRSLVWKESSTTRQSSPCCLPFGSVTQRFSLSQPSDLCPFSRWANAIAGVSSVLAWSLPTYVRREGCKHLSLLYELPRIMRSKQRFLLLLNSVLFNLNIIPHVCQGVNIKFWLQK